MLSLFFSCILGCWLTRSEQKVLSSIGLTNGKEAKHDLKGTIKKHNWFPKLSRCLLNMHNLNTRVHYQRLYVLHTQDRQFLDMKLTIAKLTHELGRRGNSMQKKKAEHPVWVYNVNTGTFSQGLGHKVKITLHINLP